ncbi:MAG: hypothetical protein LC713_04450, partial [Actinobacteria bacterium]|nr:hypothetical protein [Actinomycetota bacterium]
MATASGRDGRIYLFGGTPDLNQLDEYGHFADEYLATVQSYDPCTDSWQALPPMPGGGRAGLTASVGPDGRIYVVGGSFLYGTKQVEVYTPGLGSTPGRWETLPSMSTDRSLSAAAVGKDGRVYVIGGYTGNGGPCAGLRTAEAYGPGPGGGPWAWQSLPEMSVERFALGAATAVDGRIFAIGGGDANCDANNTVEAYDPAAGKWGIAAPMATPRSNLAVAAGDDLIYALSGAPQAVLNGSGYNRPTPTAEAYSPCTQAWLPITPMPRARVDHGAARGGDGRIYVFGGQTQSDGVTFLNPTALVDAYTPDPSAQPCPKVTVNDVTVAEPSSGSTTARFTVSLDHPPASPVRVAWATHDGTATAGSDYTASSGTLEFGPGETTKSVETPPTTAPPATGTTLPGALPVVDPVALTPPTTVPPAPDPSQTPISKTVDVPVLADGVAEGPETFTVKLTLTPATATMAKDTGVGTITETTAVSVADAPQVTEGSPAVFPVTLSSPSAAEVRVNLHTEDGLPLIGAAAPGDYTANSGTLVFKPGETTKTVSVDTVGDNVAENPENFSLVLTDPVGATMGRDRATGTIVDPGPPLPTVSVANAADVTEPPAGHTAQATFKVSVSKASPTEVRVPYHTEDGTGADAAHAGADYTGVPDGVAVFKPGETTTDVNVDVLHDDTPDGTEHFFVVLGDPTSGATVDPAHRRGEGTIVDPTPVVPVVSVTGPGSVPEPPTGKAPATFTVTLSQPATGNLTVSFHTADGPGTHPATAPADYEAIPSASVTFGPGDRSKTV